MKALTLTQPWATLVAIGAKKIETRDWRTNYRGPLAIHAAKTMNANAKLMASGDDQIWKALMAAGYTTRIRIKDHAAWENRMWLPSGAIVATCKLINVIRIPDVKRVFFPTKGKFFLPPDEPELSFGDYTPGRFAWILEDIKSLENPIPAKGMLGLWEWSGG
jgi:activating signal cointegrator 1